jgi:hypothetical protein
MDNIILTISTFPTIFKPIFIYSWGRNQHVFWDFITIEINCALVLNSSPISNCFDIIFIF